MNQRQLEPESPRLHVSLLGLNFEGPNGAKRFEITSSLTNLYDGWSLDLPVGPSGLNEILLSLTVNRWIPVTISHSDPTVDAGKPIPQLQGVITRLEHLCSDSASVLRLSGYDLGKLLDSSAPTWLRLRGYRLNSLIDKLLDPTWRAENRKDGWGIRDVTGLNRDRTRKLGRATLGRAEVAQDVNRAGFAFVPPIQVEVGETVADVLSKVARLNETTKSRGKFINVSADGYIQIFNPDDYANDAPLYQLEDHLDTRNQIIKSSSLVLDGEDLYTGYTCYSTRIAPPGAIVLDNQNPNAGKVQASASPQTPANSQAANTKKKTGKPDGVVTGQATRPFLGPPTDPINRRLTFSDEQQYKPVYCQTRADWRVRQSLYRELTLRYTLQGHSMPGVDGKRIPIVEGNIVSVVSSRHHIYENMMIEQVTKRQADAPTGTECDVILRRLGLLSA